jgi:hypothetical protein
MQEMLYLRNKKLPAPEPFFIDVLSVALALRRLRSCGVLVALTPPLPNHLRIGPGYQ